MGLTAIGDVPCIDFGLQIFALFQQRAIAWAEIVDQFGQSVPERLSLNATAGQRLRFNECVQLFSDL